MAIKNRPTLLQQFSDFINRIAPFDGNPLIQKPEHLTVETDLFDSVLLKQDSPQAINSPAAAFPIDFDGFDVYNINTTGSVGSAFTITIDNLSTGQVGRINVTKKSTDVISFANASITGVANTSQVGTAISFWINNIGGDMFATMSKSINKSDAINEDNTDQLATSKAVNDLNDDLGIVGNILQDNIDLKLDKTDVIDSVSSSSTSQAAASNSVKTVNDRTNQSDLYASNGTTVIIDDGNGFQDTDRTYPVLDISTSSFGDSSYNYRCRVEAIGEVRANGSLGDTDDVEVILEVSTNAGASYTLVRSLTYICETSWMSVMVGGVITVTGATKLRVRMVNVSSSSTQNFFSEDVSMEVYALNAIS